MSKIKLFGWHRLSSAMVAMVAEKMNGWHYLIHFRIGKYMVVISNHPQLVTPPTLRILQMSARVSSCHLFFFGPFRGVMNGGSGVSILLMEEILHQLRLVVYPMIYRVLYISGGCLGFLPSTVGGVRILRVVIFCWSTLKRWCLEDYLSDVPRSAGKWLESVGYNLKEYPIYK